MKWIVLLLIIAVAVVVLWQTGLLHEFLKPFAGWAKWIGYFEPIR